jgi:hypothetical protein
MLHIYATMSLVMCVIMTILILCTAAQTESCKRTGGEISGVLIGLTACGFFVFTLFAVCTAICALS